MFGPQTHPLSGSEQTPHYATLSACRRLASRSSERVKYYLGNYLLALPPCLLFFLSGKRNVSQPPKSLVTVFLGPHERAAMSHVLPVVGSNAHCFEFEARPTGEKGPGPKQRPLSPSQGPPQVTSSSVIPHAQVLSRIYVQIRRRVRCGVLG